MKSIKFKADYGDEERKMVISQVSGSLNGIRSFINNYYIGTVVNVFGKWIVHWVEPTERSIHQELYGPDDSEAILDRLRNAGWIDGKQPRYG